MKSSPSLKSGLLPRVAALEVLQAVASGAYADAALDRTFKKYSLKGVDRGLVTELSYGAIRQRQLLDCWVDYLGKIPSLKQPPTLRWLLHIGLYQILKMEKIPDSAAVNTTVELAKVSKLSRLAPVVNGILRAALRAHNTGDKKPPLPKKIDEKLAQEHSFPLWLIQELIDWRGVYSAELIAKASNQVPPLDLRINRSRITPEQMKKDFSAVGIESKFIENCPGGIQINSRIGNISKLPGYVEGHWCVQDRSSQWVAPLLAAKDGERVLDACAAPGGKTTHIVELMSNTGEVWAVDRSEKRLKKLLFNAQRLGSTSVKALVADASSLLTQKPSWKGYFHKILLDAPCSGLGTLARHPDARWRISCDKIDELVELQSKLLKGLLPLLSDGGRIVYSTCTFHPKENHKQIEQFLSCHSELSLRYQKQLWPNLGEGGDGFYVAVMDLN